MTKCWSDEAWEDFIYWEANNKQVYKRILIKDIDRSGFDGIGKPERLKGDLSGFWSRRIDEKNRIVYKIQDDKIYIAQRGDHYDDK